MADDGHRPDQPGRPEVRSGTAGGAEQRKVLDAFLAAASSGDVQALAAVNPAKLQSLDDV